MGKFFARIFCACNVIVIIAIIVYIIMIVPEVPIDQTTNPVAVHQEVLLNPNRTSECKGILLSKGWLLTAAHCVANGKGPLTVFYDNIKVNIKSVSVQSCSNNTFSPEDIALLKLNENHSLDITTATVQYGRCHSDGENGIELYCNNSNRSIQFDVPRVSIKSCSLIPLLANKNNDKEEEFRSSMVYLETTLPENKEIICGGIRISNDYVLTAAHCLENSINITISEENKKNEHKDYKLCLHHQWNTSEEIHMLADMAILKLRPNHSLPFTKGINIYKNKTNLGVVQGIILGWEKDINNTFYVKKIPIKILSLEDCNIYNISVTQLCLIANNTIPVGYSGGPVIVEDRLYGIISFGNETGHVPSVATNLAYYADWINTIVKENDDDGWCKNGPLLPFSLSGYCIFIIFFMYFVI